MEKLRTPGPGSSRDQCLGIHPSISCLQSIPPEVGAAPITPRAHLGEGWHGHAVRPLLEGVGTLCREGLGGHAVVRWWDGDVVLVQQVAGAAALPLLQAG